MPEATVFAGPAPEVAIARDLARRAVPVGLVLTAASAAIWGSNGALTAGLAVTIVVVNLLVAAGLMAWAARISPTALMAAVLGGFVVRMAIVVAVLFAVQDQSWVEMPLLAFTLLLAQLGLLFWETRHVSASLAFPGLKPERTVSAHTREARS